MEPFDSTFSKDPKVVPPVQNDYPCSIGIGSTRHQFRSSRNSHSAQGEICLVLRRPAVIWTRNSCSELVLSGPGQAGIGGERGEHFPVEPTINIQLVSRLLTLHPIENIQSFANRPRRDIYAPRLRIWDNRYTHRIHVGPSCANGLLVLDRE